MSKSHTCREREKLELFSSCFTEGKKEREKKLVASKATQRRKEDWRSSS